MGQEAPGAAGGDDVEGGIDDVAAAVGEGTAALAVPRLGSGRQRLNLLRLGIGQVRWVG